MAKTKAVEVAAETVTSIKAFDIDLRCRGFQFEFGKTYEATGAIVACQNGFHAVDINNPLHVWDFYPIIGDDGKLTRYAEVTQSGKMDTEKTESGTKIASASIAVNVEISLPDFIKRAVATLICLTKDAKGVTAASGLSSKLAASGPSSKLAASGDYSQMAASGHSSKLAASGDYSQMAASGHSSQLAASGDYSQLAASGDSSVIAAVGTESQISGGDGTHMALAEYDNGKCVGFAVGCVGQDGIEANTYYVAKGGKLVKAA